MQIALPLIFLRPPTLATTGNVSQPSLQPAIDQYRAILADKQAEAHERLEQVKAYVVAASRQLEHQRSQLGVLLEWCRIRQLALVGQLRAQFCAHSPLDQLAGLALRGAAALRWEPELRQMQGEGYDIEVSGGRAG